MNNAKILDSLLNAIEEIGEISTDSKSMDGNVCLNVYISDDFFVEYGLDEGEWSIGVVMTDGEIDTIEYFTSPNGDTVDISEGLDDFLKKNLSNNSEIAENIEDQIGMLEYLILESSKK